MTPQNAASHLGLFCLLIGNSSKNELKWKITPDAPKNESGLIQMIRIGKSIRHKWVNRVYYATVKTRGEKALGASGDIPNAFLTRVFSVESYTRFKL